jgi:hypothetical protein
VILSAWLCFAVLVTGFSHANEAFAQQRTITDTVQFRIVSAVDFKPLSKARVIVVGQNGRLLGTGLTNSEGAWSTRLTVPLDPRFKDIGVVTAICVANGHNENVVFEVPVKQGTIQPVTLYPIKPKLRNEPSATLGQLHHLDVLDIVNKYAQQVGLTRQRAVEGELGYAPWGPTARQGR